MDADMEIRNFSPHTRRAYLRAMHDLVRHFMRPPDRLTPEDIRQYQIHLTRGREVSPGTFNQIVAAIRFFYRVTLRKNWILDRVPYQKKPRTLPEILSPEKVRALLGALPNLKHRAILMTVYSAGLRASEVVRLKLSDIDSERGTLRIEQGKGRKDRYVMLSPRLLEVLREYGRQDRPCAWLFPGQPATKPLDRVSVHRILKRAQRFAGIPGRIYTHLLRHCFATHLLEHGVYLGVIQELLGHARLSTTQRYTHVSARALQETPSPLDLLPEAETLVPAAR
jgi:site-specific recombinase XerD